jgi:hypothetical protein
MNESGSPTASVSLPRSSLDYTALSAFLLRALRGDARAAQELKRREIALLKERASPAMARLLAACPVERCAK